MQPRAQYAGSDRHISLRLPRPRTVPLLRYAVFRRVCVIFGLKCPQSLARWNGSLFSLSFATNALVTVLIAARLWFVSRFPALRMESKS